MILTVIIIAAIFAVLLVSAAAVLIKTKKDSDGGCAGCPYRDKCKHGERNE